MELCHMLPNSLKLYLTLRAPCKTTCGDPTRHVETLNPKPQTLNPIVYTSTYKAEAPSPYSLSPKNPELQDLLDSSKP